MQINSHITYGHCQQRHRDILSVIGLAQVKLDAAPYLKLSPLTYILTLLQCPHIFLLAEKGILWLLMQQV